jgi:anhydro-N-acetylmuramic acid kinase
MSGSSLDGLDLALCTFTHGNDQDWHWEILEAGTRPFSAAWAERLAEASRLPAAELAELHVRFGHYLGEAARAFLDAKKAAYIPDVLASHGHTVFYAPERGYSLQIGHGAYLAESAGLPVICDFRSSDMAAGGQGAPLAPVADMLLFPAYAAYLNLGGIVNVSFPRAGGWLGFDVTACNQLLNALAAEADMPYDEAGRLAASGKLVPELLDQLNAPPFFGQSPPKSLSNNWVRAKLLQPALAFPAAAADKLHTACRHVAVQLERALSGLSGRLLVTGGGAHNDFLLACLAEALPALLVEKPETPVIDFKEALLMAFMGVLFLEGAPNTLREVTGARRRVVAGAYHRP